MEIIDFWFTFWIGIVFGFAVEYHIIKHIAIKRNLWEKLNEKVKRK